MDNIFSSDIKKVSKTKDYYFWHCPTLDCITKGIILFKTESPFIGNGEIKCSTCGKLHTFKQVTRENIRNIERYLAETGR